MSTAAWTRPDGGSDPIPFRTAAVLGLGLVGGSLARDLAALGVRVLGWDADAGAVGGAREAGVISASVGRGLEGLDEAEVVILAVPVDVTRHLLGAVAAAAAATALITDAGSTKAGIVRAAEAAGIGSRFVGAHPLAGDHRSGWAASRPGLFRGARTYLCPAGGATSRSVATVEALWRAVGSDTMLMGAEEHDRAMAWVSHLPQAASTALAAVLAGAGHPRTALGPGGHDTTRLAGSAPSMWTPVALENAGELVPALKTLEAALARFRGALARGDRSAVEAFFARGRDWFET